MAKAEQAEVEQKGREAAKVVIKNDRRLVDWRVLSVCSRIDERALIAISSRGRNL